MNQKVFNRRVYISGIILLVLSFLFIIHLFSIHFTDKIMLSDKKRVDIRRGYIRDRNDYILAASIELNSLFANPEEITNKEDVARVISSIISEPYEEILEKISRKKKFIWLKRKLDDQKVAEIKKFDIKGIYFKKEYKRVYPYDSLGANLIGFVGIDNNGLEGIEYSMDPVLSGEKDDHSDLEDNELYLASTVKLTIDRFVQHIAEEKLAQVVEDHSARQGAVIVSEVDTGRILALARYPSYNPNYYYQYTPFDRRNYTVIDAFEPGSTMKILSVAAMIEYAPEAFKYAYECTGSIDIGDVTINCAEVHGTVDLDEAVTHSCNVGIIQAIKKVKREELYDVLYRFGFGKKTGIELPGETSGILRSPDQWSGLSKSSISIGHEMSATSLQLVAAFGAVANGGVYYLPKVIESVERPDGTVIQEFYPESRGRVLSVDVAKKLLSMMHEVTATGTGTQAASAYFDVAGKTGTSQKYLKREYTDRVISSFIGVAPYQDPKVCCLVVIDDPVDKLSGGKIAAPIFSSLIDSIVLSQGVIKTGIKGTVPLHIEDTVPKFDGTTVPDFRGLKLPGALQLLHLLQQGRKIEYSLSGSGTVAAQSPAPGTPVTEGQKIVLFFKE